MRKTITPSQAENDRSAKGDQGDQGDRSLRANGATYFDRDSESDKIYGRLMHSSASVIGIAGQRGAGKSSLAQKLLQRAEDDGAYTQLIHLPTVSDSREFLIAIFQSVCEEVVSQIEKDLGQHRSLKEYAKVAIGRITKQRRIILTAMFLLLSVPFIYFQFRYFIETLGDIDGLTIRADLILIGITVLTMVVLIAWWLLLPGYSLVSRQIRFARKDPNRAGLRQYALELIEHLEFQTTLSSAQEAGVQMPSLSGKWSSGKSLAARPLSLPGISTQFARFLDHVAAIHSKKRVVICFDELDKIENPRDLDKLLRGIKGILGHPKTHFLLTVSEDALARYVKQRRLEKGMLESAFEEIVPLNPVDPSVARQVIDCICPAKNDENLGEIERISTALFWLFGGGNPREIKRNVLTCLEAGLEPNEATGVAIWEELLRSRLQEMKMWASNVGTNDDITFRFLCCLQESQKLLEQINGLDPLDLEWARTFASIWKQDFDLDKLASGKQGAGGTLTETEIAHAGAVLDILLGASALAYVIEKGSKLSDVTIEQLKSIFQIRTYNIAFAGKALEEYLKHLRISKSIQDIPATC